MTVKTVQSCRKCLSPFYIVAIVFAVRSLAFAVDYVWTNDTAKTGAKWNDVANWHVNGEIPNEPPTNGAHTVQFGPLAHDGRQEIELDTGKKAYTLALSSMTDETPGSRRTIYVKNAYEGLKEVPVDVTIGDLSGFAGYWRSRYGRVLFNLGDGDVLSNVAADHRARVSVPASASATLGTLYTAGTLDKQGAGELTVDATQGADTVLTVSDGTLTLTGSPAVRETGDDLPVAGAWLHLDASRPETFKTYVDPEDGRTYVTNWCDVRGNGVYAWFDSAWHAGPSQSHLTAYSHAPFLNDAFVAGKTVVDFGRDDASQSEALGPMACWLKLSQTKTNVREVFYAGCYLRLSSSTIIPGSHVDGNYNFHRAPNMLANTTYGSPGVRFGDVLVNNEPQSNQWAPTTNMHVFCVGSTNNLYVNALATDRLYSNRVGGARLGEFILFTNALTHVERVRIQTHLMHKWGVAVVSQEALDASVATLVKDTSALSVPEGRTVAVGEVTTGAGMFVKKGAGRLDVGVLAVPATGTAKLPSLDVRAGDVSFTGVAQPATDQEPAANPWLWLDATASSSFVFTNKQDDATQYVARWKDRRAEQDTIWAEIPASQSDYAEGNFAEWVPNAIGDFAVVDFGPSGTKSNGSSYLKLNSAGYQKSVVNDAFIVFRHKTSNLNVPVFGYSSSIHLYRASTSKLLQGDYGLSSTHNAIWTVDGVPVDPLASEQGAFKKDQVYVVSMSLADKVYVDLVGCKDRIGQGTAFGGVQVAEQLLYNRRLTPAERRQTIAYLMKRWQNRTPVFAQKQELGDVKYAADAPVVVDSEPDVSVGTVSGGNGAFVKKGAGTLTMSSFDAAAIDSISVEKGRTELSLDLIGSAAFHFDASDVDSLTYYVTDDGARTNVTSVADVRRNGIRADSWINVPTIKDGVERGVSATNPVWRTVEAAPGVYRPTFDFGRKSGYYSTKYASSSTFTINENFPSNNAARAIREAHAVFANNAEKDGGTVFCHSSHYCFMSGGVKLFNGTYSAPAVKNGYVALDGEAVTWDSAYPASGLHVLSVVPNGPTSINALSRERNIEAGGLCISEYIGFTNVLTAAQRTCLQQYLLNKWTGSVEAPAFPKTFDSIDVAAGATLEFKGGLAVSAAKVSGSGRLAGAKVHGVAELEVACANGDTVPATVDAGVAFAHDVEVVFTGDGSPLAPGEHVLLRTGALSVDGVDWTFTGQDFARWGTSLYVSDGNLVLRLSPKGTTVILR